MTDRRKVRVYCKTLSKWFKSIRSAAKFAGVDDWSMSKKMEAAGSFIDEKGNEYIREKPMNTKNTYENTGKTLKRVFKRKRTINKPVKENTEKDFTYGELPKPIQELINEKITDMCNNNMRWEEIRSFMLKMGCKKVTIELKDNRNAE